jgi:hypothetical protein
MRTTFRIAAALLFAASCTGSDDSPADVGTSTSPLTSGQLAFDAEARALLSPDRQALYDELATKSTSPPRFTLERASNAATSIALDLPPMAASPRDTALAFVKQFQKLLDDRIAYYEYRVTASPQGCDNAVISLDRFVSGTQVIGSRLSLYFDERGHLTFVVNGVAPVPATIVGVDPYKFPGAQPLSKLLPQKVPEKGVNRVPVLAPAPDGSGLFHADLGAWVDERGDYSAATVIGSIAITPRLTAAHDGSPHPTGPAPQAFLASGETIPSFLSFRGAGGADVNGFAIERNPIERSYRFFEEHATIYHTGAARCQLVPRAISETPEGDVIVRFGQQHGTLPIFGAELIVSLEQDKVASVLGQTLDNLAISLTPVRTPTQAIADADSALARGAAMTPSWNQMIAKSQSVPAVTRLGVLHGSLSRIGGDSNGGHRLVYEVKRGAFTFYVDGKDGRIRYASSGIQRANIVNDGVGRTEFEFAIPGLYLRESTDGVHVPSTPFNIDTGNLIPGRGGGTTSQALIAISSTYAGMGWFGQNGRGSDFIVNTNVNPITTPCQNAFYDSTFTNSAFHCLGAGTNDSVGHELAHGVIASSSGLVYQDQSGAINEAFADLMGNTIFREPGGTWLLFEDDTVTGALRDMAAPAHMSGYLFRDGTCDVFPWSCDSGFVHTNSGIINKAHQLLADGVPGDPAAPGIGRDKLFFLGFRTMTGRLPANARMNDVPLAERDVCESLVRAGASDLTGVPFTVSDCDQIPRAFMQVGLAPGLTAAWSEPELGFVGSRTFYPSPTDLVPPGCVVTNVTDTLVQLSGAQTIDMDPTTPMPPSLTWLGLSGLSVRVPGGTPPFPLGTRFKTHTIDWFAVYGILPSLYPDVIITCAPVPPVELSRPSAAFSENNPWNSGTTRTIGTTSTTLESDCNLVRTELELLDGAGNTFPNEGTSTAPRHTITHWFVFVPVNFTTSARIVTPPATGPTGTAPRNLSASIFYGYDLGRGINVRLRYVFMAPAGRMCVP